MNWKRLIPILALVVIFAATSAMAQPNKPWKTTFGHVAGGYVLVEGYAGEAVDDGWNLSGGATIKKSEWPIAISFDLGWNDFNIKDSALYGTDEKGDPVRIADNGDVTVWSLTADLMWSTKNEGTVGFYLMGGLGAYYQKVQLTNAVWVPGWGCGFYWCVPGYWPGNEIVGSNSSWDWGYNAGVGLNFNLESDSQIFIEARYHWVQGDLETEYVPIVVGYRW